MQSVVNPKFFAGGDIVGSGTNVEAANDGKTAAWNIHRYIKEANGLKLGEEEHLPGFYTAIDDVDLSIDFLGKRFVNPLGLASAPPVTTWPMIRRAFECGWGYVVTKTFGLEENLITNVAPRIFKSTGDPYRRDGSFNNIELISEKTAK